MLIRLYLDRFQQQNPKDIEVYLVEIAPSADSFRFTSSDNPRHLQHIDVDVMKQTEGGRHRLRNLAIQKLLSATWEAMA